MEFCKQFNARTQAQAKDDVTIPVEITVYSDRSFTFITKTPPAPILIKKAAGLATPKKPGSGSKEPNKVKVGKISQKQLRDIATMKMPDLNTTDVESAMRTIAGTARSMGVEVEGLRQPVGPEESKPWVKHGKKFRNAVGQGRSQQALPDRRGLQARRPKPRSRSSTRASTSPSAWASIPKHADQMVRGAVVLPHGTGKSQRVVVVAKGDKANEARAAGADAVGAEELVEKIQKENWTDFDSMVATPDMMGLVGRLGRVLGPKGLMPNPKVGTVTNDVAKAVRELKAGRVEFRVEKAGRRPGPHRQGVVRRREAARQRPRHDRDAAAAQAAVGQGDVHEVGDRLHHHGARDQDRPPAAGRRVRDQVAGHGSEFAMEQAVKEENISALKATWPRRPAWCWPTSAASPSRATRRCAASSAPTAASTRS